MAQMVVRYGERIIYRDVETADGQLINLTVAQYISYDLGADSLQFSHALYSTILQEAVDHSADPGFKAEPYFTAHADMDISREATEMAMERFHLGKALQAEPTEGQLCEQVKHLVLDFRMDYVENKLKALQRDISLAVNDNPRMMQLLSEYKDMQTLRNAIARELGSQIIA